MPLGPDDYVDVLAETGMGIVCILGADGRIVLFDEACERATGFAAADVVGRDARETAIPPEEADAFGELHHPDRRGGRRRARRSGTGSPQPATAG